MIIKQLNVGYLNQLCYIVGCNKTRKGIVIDPGGKVDKILSEVKNYNIDLELILNTHAHTDHILGNDLIKKETGAKIVVHKDEKDLLISKENYLNIPTYKYEPSPPADIVIGKEQELKVGEIMIKILHTPGHSTGSLCYLIEDNLFTGDTLFVGDSGRTDLDGGDRKILGKSLRRIMSMLPDDTSIWPGHDIGKKSFSTIGKEKRSNINAKEYGFYVKD
jgi:glyoxylase-like metal-dependent hydrolase (beta-lactamase superfamily II)